MGIVGLDLSFLDGIELNDPVVKAVRFNDDEMYMLKFIAYKGMKFSSYVKQLIIRDIRKHCNKENVIGSISKDDIKEIMLEVLRENNYTRNESNEEGCKYKKEDEEIMALAELGISKRTS